MNFLAHAFLSFDDPGVLAGNMIGDFVKGRQLLEYPPEMQAGIMLHRLIDSYTDEHPATRAAKEPFRPAYRLYSGAIVDVLYDHFLANDMNEFPEDSLSAFSQKTYTILNSHLHSLPPNFRTMLPYMQQEDWLYNYQSKWGIGKSLHGLIRRATYLTESDTAMKLLDSNYQLLQDCYRQFWSDMKPYAFEQYARLQNEIGK
jgi:acyl carrier protein phosphodiesterase